MKIKKSFKIIILIFAVIVLGGFQFAPIFCDHALAVLGVDWVSLPAGDAIGIKFGTNRITSMAYGNGKFVAVGWGGYSSYSSDGILGS